ncbi:MAG: archaetidylserine decarboxylase [Leptospirales bacterium]|nr:archaetidylserine decarboxylase [Leptospirales bacterium]
MTELLQIALVLLGIAGALYLAIAFRLPFLPPLRASLFALAGVRDRAATVDRPRPWEAFLAAASFDVILGGAIAGWFAAAHVGPGALIYIWIAAIAAGAMEFNAAAAPALRSLRFTPALAFIAILCAIFQGAALPASLTVQLWEGFALPPWIFVTLALACTLGYTLIWMARPLAQRVLIRYAAKLGLVSTLVALLIDLCTRSAAGHGAAIVAQFVPDSVEGLLLRLLTAGVFLTVAASGGLRSVDWALRLEDSELARPALALMLRPYLAAVVASVVLLRMPQAGAAINEFVLAALGLAALSLGLIQFMAAAETAARTLRLAIGAMAARWLLLLLAPALLIAWFWSVSSPESDATILGGVLLAGGLSTLAAWLRGFMHAEEAQSEYLRYREREALFDAPGFGDSLMLLFLHAFPSALLSRLFGLIARLPIAPALRPKIFGWYIRKFGVNIAEAEKTPAEYGSMVDFFTRALKPGLRPIDAHPAAVVSPVDGVLARSGLIHGDAMIQAKGLQYSCLDLLGSAALANQFEGGWYCTIYLSPRDYHRIHTPLAGEILGYDYRPGLLLPVNLLAVSQVRDLFPKNERLTTLMQCGRHMFAMVKVGATNVGSMRVTYADVRTNRWHRNPAQFRFPVPQAIARGAELGRFEMGSTVVLLFSKGAVRPTGPGEDRVVRLGEAIALLQR